MISTGNVSPGISKIEHLFKKLENLTESIVADVANTLSSG